jgi:hypothetical protein
VKEVRQALKALSTRSNSRAWLTWLNEVRTLWHEQREVEDDAAKKEEMKKLITKIDETLSGLLQTEELDHPRSSSRRI